MTAQHKRAVALGLIGECAESLGAMRDAASVRALLLGQLEQAYLIQGGEADRPYFARTVSQVANLARRHGWVDIAGEALEWGLTRGAIDGHLLSEVAECHLARGDVFAAEQTLVRAESAGVPTDAIYTSLVKAYGRSGRPDAALEAFERARQAGAVTPFTYPALIAAYAVAGNLVRAREVFEAARVEHQLSAPAYTAMATALAGRGRVDELDALVDEARAVGEMSSRLALTSIRLRLEWRQFAAARRVLESARADGVADVACYVTTITACHRAGRHREAKRVVASAVADAQLASDDLRRIRAAHGRARRAVPQGGDRPIAA